MLRVGGAVEGRQPRAKGDVPLVYTFGRGSDGQLGCGQAGLADRVSAAQPVELPTSLSAIAVACGGLHTVAVTDHGHLYTWGHAAKGQTGLSTHQPITRPHLLPSSMWDGRAELERRVPITVSAEEEGGRSFVVQGRRFSPLQVASVSCGQYHTALATTEGEVYAWGSNSDGQLGQGDTEDRRIPHAVPAEYGALVVQVACGGRHTLALCADGRAWGWGCNGHKQAGARGGSPLRPLMVSLLSSTRLVQVACGGAHSAAVTADGALITWGKNQNGQLGHGKASPSEEPQAVKALPHRVAWVACGGAHSAAMLRLQDSSSGIFSRSALSSSRSAATSARSARSDASSTPAHMKDTSFMQRYNLA